jgi:hypothetical protein
MKFILTIMNVALLGACWYLYEQNDRLLERNTMLESSLRRIEAEQLHQKEIALASPTPEPSPLHTPAATATAQETATPEPEPSVAGSLPHSSAQWLAGERVKELERVLALSPDERTTLIGKLAQAPLIELTSDEGTALISEVFADDRAEEIVERLQQQAQSDENERIASIASAFTRKLNILDEQQEAVVSVIREVEALTATERASYTKMTQEITARHNDPQASRQTLQDKFLEMKALGEQLKATKKELYQERLREILTAEQMGLLDGVSGNEQLTN